MPAVAQDAQTQPETWQPTQQEWDAFVRRSLEELGLTHDELAKQADTGDFVSAEAMALWTTIS